MRRKKLLIALTSILALVALLALLAPTLASGFVRSRVEQELASRLNGTVALRSLDLGWFSAQRVGGLTIDGGDQVGKVSLDAEVSEGLLALLRGSDITLTLAGEVQTRFDEEGRIGLATLAKPVPAEAPAAGPAAEPVAEPVTGSPLGTRALRVRLDGVALSAAGPDGASYALEKLEGDLSLVDGVLSIALDAVAKSSGREGELSVDAASNMVFSPDGSVDLARSSGTIAISASRISWPTSAGELAVSRLKIDVAKDEPGNLRISSDIVARIAGSSESTVKADITLTEAFDAEGRFSIDPSDIGATIEAKGVPLAALQPFAPEIIPGARLELVRDLGDTADLTVSKERGDRARVELVSRQVQVAFDGAVAPDGSSIERGTLTARIAARPELLAALGVPEPTPLEASLRAEQIAWKKGDDAIRSFGASIALELSKPFDLTIPAVATRVRAQTLKCAVDKKLGDAAARATANISGRYGATGDFTLGSTLAFDLASRALTEGTLDANARVDSSFVERMSNGAVSAQGTAATLRVAVPELAYIPSDEFSGLRALVARVRVELEGALAVEGAGTTAAVNDLAIDLTTPRGSKPGALLIGAKVDGAELRIEEAFGPFPASGALDLAALSPKGSIAVDGLDPAFITRIAPESGKSVGLLGRGKLRLDARNRIERGAVVADFTLDAASVDASGSVRYEPTAIAASNLAIDAELTPEVLASLDLGKSVELEPGTRVSVRAPMIALRRVDTTADDGVVAASWQPAGDLAARVVIERLRARRAPGIVEPIAISKIDATASYVFADHRATANGKALLGANGADGTIDFRLGWVRPTGPRLFAGAEGGLEITDLDLARVETALGLEQGRYSGMLGGAGLVRIDFNEEAGPRADLTCEFPRTRGRFALSAPDSNGARTARVAGTLFTEVDADTFAQLAAINRDPTRRVLDPIKVELALTSMTAPLDQAMKPEIAAAAFDVTASLSAINLETVDSGGRKTTLSTGALRLSAKSARLAEEVTVRVTGDEASAATGALEVDARIRGLVAAQPGGVASPVVHAAVRAQKFPAATVDALAGTGGAVARYLGDAIDAQVDAHDLSAAGGTLSAKLSSEFATLDAPALSITDGMLRVAAEQPLVASFALSPAVREQLLASIHPVFSDVSSGTPAKFTLSTLAWPLDGDRKRLDAAFALETGELKLVNSSAITMMLALANAGRTDGFDAYLEPLRATIAKGRLTYRDFTLRAGKTAQGSWRNSLVFAGDIDLAAKPIRANSITTSIPLSDAANWSADARGIFDSLGAASPELVKSLTVGIEIKGPLFDPSGKPVKPDPKLKLPDVGDVLRDNPGAIIDAAGGLLDLINKPKPPKPKQPNKQGKKKQQPDSPPSEDAPPAAPPQG